MEATELRGLRVQFISYVENPANDKKFFIVKSEDAKESNVRKNVKILTSKESENDDMPHEIHGVVYSPGEVDLQGEFMTAKEIKKSAHQFIKDYRLIDKDHNTIPGAGEVIESHTTFKDQEINDEFIPKGSWILATQPDEETWEAIQKGTYTGYSLFGFAKDKVTTEVRKSIWEKVKNFFGVNKGIVQIKKDFETELQNYKNTDFWYLFYIFEEAIGKITWDNPEINGAELKDKIVKNLEQLVSTVKDMTFEKVEKEFEVSKPYPNEHACRLNDPDKYDNFSRKEREHEGKKYSVIYGIKEDGKSEEQAYRYNTDTWSEGEAKKHCSEHDGSFHASSEDEDTETSKSKQGDEMDEELKEEVEGLISKEIDELKEELKTLKKEFGNIGETVKEAINNANEEVEDDDDDEDDDDEPNEEETKKSFEQLKEDVEEAKKSVKSLQESLLESQQAISDLDNDDDGDDEVVKEKREGLGLPSVL